MAYLLYVRPLAHQAYSGDHIRSQDELLHGLRAPVADVKNVQPELSRGGAGKLCRGQGWLR